MGMTVSDLTPNRRPRQMGVEAFRAEVRAWLEAHAPQSPVGSEDDWHSIRDHAPIVHLARELQSKLFEAGLAALLWPQEYGGQGLGIEYQIAFNDETEPFQLPTSHVLSVSLGQCGHAVLLHGTEDQRLRHLPAIARGLELWCLLLSEPDAGSDLAAIRTSATRTEGGYLIDGQKIWASFAQYADRGLLVARSDKARGARARMTTFLLDMRSPGIEVRPLVQMTGGTSFNEVFFDNVFVPDADVLGQPDHGWGILMSTLMRERYSRITTRFDRSAVSVEDIVELARGRGVAGESYIQQRVADLWIKEQAAALLRNKIVSSLIGGAQPGPEGSLAKLVMTNAAQSAARLAVEIADIGAIAWEPNSEDARWPRHLLSSRARSIAGGTTEIQRNTIAERILGLPRDPRPRQ